MDLVTVAFSGDYGKPRPCLVIQANDFADHISVTVIPFTSDLKDAGFRIPVHPAAGNSLEKISQLMIDKIATYPRAKVGRTFGHLDPARMEEVNQAIAVWLGLA